MIFLPSDGALTRQDCRKGERREQSWTSRFKILHMQRKWSKVDLAASFLQYQEILWLHNMNKSVVASFYFLLFHYHEVHTHQTEVEGTYMVVVFRHIIFTWFSSGLSFLGRASVKPCMKCTQSVQGWKPWPSSQQSTWRAMTTFQYLSLISSRDFFR